MWRRVALCGARHPRILGRPRTCIIGDVEGAMLHFLNLDLSLIFPSLKEGPQTPSSLEYQVLQREARVVTERLFRFDSGAAPPRLEAARPTLSHH